MPEFSDYIIVPDDYFFSYEDDVYAVMEKSFKNDLDTFLKRHLQAQHTDNYQSLPVNYLKDFPFIEYAPFRHEIFSRKQDLAFIETLASSYFSNNKPVLEIGGWNGWLANRLHNKGLQVVTADIFSDEVNGLRAKKFYHNNNWLSIQTDLTSTKIYKKKFDLIILNHCLQFLAKPEQLILEYRGLLADNGLLIVTGLGFYGRIERQRKKVQAYRGSYFKRHHSDIQFYPSEGCFGNDTYRFFTRNNFNFLSYRFSVLGSIKKKMLLKKHGIMYYKKQVDQM